MARPHVLTRFRPRSHDAAVATVSCAGPLARRDHQDRARMRDAGTQTAPSRSRRAAGRQDGQTRDRHRSGAVRRSDAGRRRFGRALSACVRAQASRVPYNKESYREIQNHDAHRPVRRVVRCGRERIDGSSAGSALSILHMEFPSLRRDVLSVSETAAFRRMPSRSTARRSRSRRDRSHYRTCAAVLPPTGPSPCPSP